MQVNLISDTVTKPSKEMLKVMFNATVGDDTFKQDPTVVALETTAAELFGMEAALFCPSGTMTNQIAIKCHTSPGDSLITSSLAHVYNYEGGGVAANSGVTCQFIDQSGGRFTADQLQSAIGDPSFYHAPKQTLVVIENTTNKGGGQVWDFEEIKSIKKVCSKNGLKLHLDGARLFNALSETSETPLEYGEQFDSISICLSKGLGAPVGSLLLGNTDFIERAYRIRKIMGGNMRQSGYLAAAGIYALGHNRFKLKEDHKKLAQIAAKLEQLPFITIQAPKTNILLFTIDQTIDPNAFMAFFKERGILFIPFSSHTFRITTHLDISDKMVGYVLETIDLLSKKSLF